MNDMLAQTHTPGMRADRDTKLGGHQQNSEHLTHTSEADGVNLADVDGFSLEQLLEDHPVMCMFACRDANTIWLESLSDGGMTEDIVWSSGLFNEPGGRRSEWPRGKSRSPVPGLNFSQAFGVLDRLIHLPNLVRVNHQYRTRRSSIFSLQSWAVRIQRLLALGKVLRIVDDGSDEFTSSEVRLEVTSDFHLEVVETFRDSFFRQAKDLLIRVSEPACRSDVGGITQ